MINILASKYRIFFSKDKSYSIKKNCHYLYVVCKIIKSLKVLEVLKIIVNKKLKYTKINKLLDITNF